MMACASAEYLHFARIVGPYLYSRNGKGAKVKAKNAGILDAQWMPRRSYMIPVKSGNTAAKTDLKIAVPARTEAAKIV